MHTFRPLCQILQSGYAGAVGSTRATKCFCQVPASFQTADAALNVQPPVYKSRFKLTDPSNPARGLSREVAVNILRMAEVLTPTPLRDEAPHPPLFYVRHSDCDAWPDHLCLHPDLRPRLQRRSTHRHACRSVPSGPLSRGQRGMPRLHRHSVAAWRGHRRTHRLCWGKRTIRTF